MVLDGCNWFEMEKKKRIVVIKKNNKISEKI
jgi:hypothetical protein